MYDLSMSQARIWSEIIDYTINFRVSSAVNAA